MGLQRRVIERGAGREHHHGDRLFAPAFVGHADHGGVGDGGVHAARHAGTNATEGGREGEAGDGDPVRLEAEVTALRAMTAGAVKLAVATYVTVDNAGVLKIIPQPKEAGK